MDDTTKSMIYEYLEKMANSVYELKMFFYWLDMPEPDIQQFIDLFELLENRYNWRREGEHGDI